jgi:hypothetical protein
MQEAKALTAEALIIWVVVVEAQVALVQLLQQELVELELMAQQTLILAHR